MCKVKAIQNHDGLCWNCLNSFDPTQIHKIYIGEMGYGSAFDGESTEVHLCDECFQKSNPEIWSMEVIEYDDYCEEYVHENAMLDYIHELPLEGRQFVENEFSSEDHQMEAQDWIDYELDILPHEKCKEYGRYSPQEKSAYEDRFPMCDKVYKKIYPDGSSGCWCDYGAHGNSDGTCEQTYSECYMCTQFEVRKDAMKTINVTEEETQRERERLKEMIKYATSHLKSLNDNPLKYLGYDDDEE